MRSLLKTLAALGLVGVVTPVACAGLVLATLVFLPLPATLPTATPTLDSRTTHVLDSYGNEIAIFKEFETAIPVAPEDIPQILKDAVVASEDRNFYSHGGVDLRGTLRALWTDIESGEAAQGGSTITQQYVRLAFEEVGTERTIARKIREAILASQLDRQVDKDTILYQYLQNAYFGEGAYGIGAAAQTYFRKNPRDLTLSEAALLVGVLPAPTAYSPRDHPDVGERRRQLVLDVMLDVGSITAEEHAAASAEHVYLFGSEPAPVEGQPFTVVLPPEIQQSSQPYFTDYVRSWLEANLPGCPGAGQRCPLLYQGGLQVETTLDPFAQLAAQEEATAVLDGEVPTLEAAVVSVEPPTGFVRAMVGGRDYATSQVNVALSERQPGSTFKTLVLAEAFEQGIQPTATYSGAAYTVGDYTCGSRGGTQTLVSATTNSVNGVFCRLIEEVGVRETFDMATRLGISMPAYAPGSTQNAVVDAADPTRVYGLATALGAVEASPLEMASAYAVFANHGLRAAPIPVLRVLDNAGNVILDNTNAAASATQVIAPEIADNVTDVLRNVLTDGTAAGRALADRPAAGKTGTSQDNANAWFIGYTPTLSTAVWFGYIDCGAGEQCALRGVAGVSGTMTGGSAPARLWQRYMNRALDGVPVTEFTEPAPIPDVRDQVERESRGGFDPGRRRYPDGPPASEGFVEDEPSPVVEIPTTSTTSTVPPSTTSTTRPGGGPPTTQGCSGLLCPN
jgi:membrane peptidoglycan carboxypeptidase